MSDPVIPAATAKERTQNWLKDVYRAELGREADAEGLKYWADDIAKGATRNEVLSNIRRSDEKWLADTYQTELGRDLGTEGREYWMGDLRGKGSGKEDLTYGSDRPVQTRDQVLENIRRSDEYKTYQAGDDGIIDGRKPIIIDEDDDDVDDTSKKKDPNEDWRNIDWGKFNPNTAPEYKIDPNSPGISAAVSAGNRMTDDFYGRFLPNWKRTTDLGTTEIGISNNLAMNRLFNRDASGNVTGINISLPEYQDPKEQFDYYWDKMYGDKDD
jgi:hypothetical protein